MPSGGYVWQPVVVPVRLFGLTGNEPVTWSVTWSMDDGDCSFRPVFTPLGASGVLHWLGREVEDSYTENMAVVVAAGTAVITATVGGKSYSVTVTVEYRTVDDDY